MSEPSLKKVERPSVDTVFGLRWPFGAQAMALRSLAGSLALCVREDGTWYVNLPNVELRKGGLLVTPTQKGADPHEAIVAAWNDYGASDAVVVVSRPGYPRRVLRWNTFMWVDLDPNAVGAEP